MRIASIRTKNPGETTTLKFSEPIDMALLFIGAVTTAIGAPRLRDMKTTCRCGRTVLLQKKPGGEDGLVTG
jgi:hypothetical protein